MTNDAGETADPGDEVRAAFGRDLKSLRESRGWTIEQAADKAMITRKTWGRIEAGRAVRGPSIRGLELAFGVPSGAFADAYAGQDRLLDAYQRAAENSAMRSVMERRPPVADTRATERQAFLLRDLQEAIPQLPTTALANIESSIRATLFARRRDAEEQIADLEVAYRHAVQRREDARRAHINAEVERVALENELANAASNEDKTAAEASAMAAAQHLAIQERAAQEAMNSADVANYQLAKARQELDQIEQVIRSSTVAER